MSTDYKPLDGARLAAELAAAGRPWTAIEAVPQTGSTNSDLIERATAGALEGLVLVAEEQIAGRGRLGRAWVSPPGTALTFSVLLRPAGLPVTRRGWLPLIAGIATATAVREASGLDARLKWPNDVLIGNGKVAGILAETTGDAVVIGIGANVSTTPADLPAGPGGLRPTSLLAEGVTIEREDLLIAILREMGARYEAFRAKLSPESCGLLAEYRDLSATLGKNIRVDLPGSANVAGVATGVDPDGRLLVRAGAKEHAIAAGDVIHVRALEMAVCPV
jgi:BirA family transcriptional regulator, biotin operon repressor / biotin---[acetyl-CoA-carboxylase] ligase